MIPLKLLAVRLLGNPVVWCVCKASVLPLRIGTVLKPSGVLVISMSTFVFAQSEPTCVNRHSCRAA